MNDKETRPLCVLAVDDDADNRESVAVLLEMDGHEVAVAASGAEAVEQALRKAPDVVLLDIGMPGEDGYAVARRLREVLPRRPLIVALTGFGQVGDHDRSHDEGFDFHLVKPAEAAEIRAVLASAPRPAHEGGGPGRR